MNEFINIKDLVTKLPLTKNEVFELTKNPDFPQPIIIEITKMVYDKEEINNYLKSNGLPEL